MATLRRCANPQCKRENIPGMPGWFEVTSERSRKRSCCGTCRGQKHYYDDKKKQPQVIKTYPRLKRKYPAGPCRWCGEDFKVTRPITPKRPAYSCCVTCRSNYSRWKKDVHADPAVFYSTTRKQPARPDVGDTPLGNWPDRDLFAWFLHDEQAVQAHAGAARVQEAAK